MGKKLDFAIGILNGAIGDHLVRTDNGLAIEMAFMKDGAQVAPADAAIGPRVVVLVHGLMCTESIWEFPDGDDYGARLARDHGYTPLYVRYNTGRAIFENGEALSTLLARLVAAHPGVLDEVLLLGYSMGGLVARSACHAAATSGAPWLPLVRRAIYVGTPHQGAPLERVGRAVSRVLREIPDPYTRLIAEIADLRSEGVKDLGESPIRGEDRVDADRAAFSLREPTHPVPLLPQIRHRLIAGAVGEEPWMEALFGDAMVPVTSALGRRTSAPPCEVTILRGQTHATLPHADAVYEVITEELSGGERP